MPTASDLIQETRQHLLTGQPEQLNKLSSGITASTSDVTLLLTYDLRGIQAGAVLDIDLEQIYVFAVTSATKTVTDCIRGYNGTTPAIHASGATVTVNPKFPTARILTAINNDLKDLSSPVNGLYQIKTVDITFNPTTYGYDLTSVTDIISIAEVRFRSSGSQKTWPQITNYALLRNMPTTGTYGDFPSGNALVIYESAQSGLPIRLRYRAPFTSLATLADDVVAVSGLQATSHDIPPLGAAIRLVAGREVKRNFDEAQGEPRRAEEVPPQASVQSTRELVRLRQQRIMAEQARLLATFSYEMVG
jgi:hypothetical protein